MVASLSDLAAITRAIGGNDVEITVLSSATQDPHYVDPRPSSVLLLYKADFLVVNGLELESAWLRPLQLQSRSVNILQGNPGYLDASSVISKLEIPTSKLDRAQGDIPGGGNPHFTFAPGPANLVATAIARRLTELESRSRQRLLATARKVHKSKSCIFRHLAKQISNSSKSEAKSHRVSPFSGLFVVLALL
ncbi:MAG: zinc ABC transporter solute-binding protein [Deltaproteobacteria bacterium]|nr:zinc ABC transporter solute-binding protein [Deltaproteobacteria bacterium]